jgi:type IV pilus assembly protein PilZ
MSTKHRPSTDDAAGDLAGRGAAGVEAVDRRGATRVLVDLEVDYGDTDNFLFASIRDLSATGIFVRTNAPESPGTHLNLRFTPTGSERTLELEGKVIWVNKYRPGDSTNLNPGMGVRFIGLTNQQRYRLVEFVRTFAYLDE